MYIAWREKENNEMHLKLWNHGESNTRPIQKVARSGMKLSVSLSDLHNYKIAIRAFNFILILKCLFHF